LAKQDESTEDGNSVCFSDPDNCHTDPDPSFYSGVDPDLDSTLPGAL
jgi:hypothetical protein